MSKSNTVAKVKKHVVTFAGKGELDRLLTVQDVAALLRCSVSSLNKWRLTGNGPRFVYVGTRVRYHPTDVAAYVADATRSSTSQMAMPP